MPHSPVRVGILGVGQRGLQHLRVLWDMQSQSQVQVTALCDAWKDNLSEAKIQRFVPGYRGDVTETHTSFEHMLAGKTIDALYICLPPGVHNGEVVAAAQAGVHVFVEKPMSLYYDEALDMERAIRTSGVISTAGFQQRYDYRFEGVRDFLKGRRIVLLSSTSHGALESHSVKHTHTEEVGGPSNRVWTANLEWSGSAVVESGIHTVDSMRYWCGDIDWVQAVYVPRDEADTEQGGNNPYVCVVTLGFHNGAIGTLHISKLRRVFHSDGSQIILWDRGHLKFEQDGPAAYYYDGPYPPEHSPAVDQIRHPIPTPPCNDSLTAINRAFISAIATNDPTMIRSGFSEAMNSLAAVLAANVSHALHGERIDLHRFAHDERYMAFRQRNV